MQEEELKKLQDANKILNERYSDLGLKPLDFPLPNPDQAPLDEFLNDDYVIDDIHPDFHNIPQEEANEIESLLLDEALVNEVIDDYEIEGSQEDEAPRFVLVKRFVLPVLILAGIIFIISSELRESLFKTEELKEEVTYAKPVKRKNMVQVISVNDRPYIISSGSYKTREEAKSAKNELAKIAGTSLRLKFLKDYYTVQIGPAYKEFDNAVLVYKELSKYPIKDLSIRTQR